MVSEPGNTSPPPNYSASRPVPPAKPTPNHQDQPGAVVVVLVVGGGGAGAVRGGIVPLQVHWMHTLQRMMGEFECRKAL